MAKDDELAKNIVAEMLPHIQNIKKDYVRETCQEILPQVLEKTFIQLGINTNEPIEMQKDFAHLRATRDVKKRFVGEAIRIGFAGFVAYMAFVWNSIKGIGH
jgi:hypothetical protein